MITTLYGFKLGQSRLFLEDGNHIAVTHISIEPTVVARVIDDKQAKGYLLAIGDKRQVKKPITGIMKKAGVDKKPRFLRQSKASTLDESIVVGSEVKEETVFAIGDSVQITGISKGKGFAGVVKRHGFSGGPKTHGQGDRWRSPGSIGAGTTPGRVYRGLRMAGRMGNDTITVKRLKVVALDTEKHIITVKGLIPGAIKSLVKMTKEN